MKSRVSGRRLSMDEYCHVCGDKLLYDLQAEQMVCTNPKCQVRKVRFTIPYEVPGEEQRIIGDELEVCPCCGQEFPGPSAMDQTFEKKYEVQHDQAV